MNRWLRILTPRRKQPGIAQAETPKEEQKQLPPLSDSALAFWVWLCQVIGPGKIFSTTRHTISVVTGVEMQYAHNVLVDLMNHNMIYSPINPANFNDMFINIHLNCKLRSVEELIAEASNQASEQ